MDGTIYLIGKDGELEEMSQQPYEKEDILQGYLEKYPNLLAGDQMNESNPRRWLLVSREMGVPKEEGGPDTWALDHLFLDQDGIPTLVEVKRSSDTRSRREVVAQMLDYAANAVVHWPVERIRGRFEALCQERGAEPVERVLEFLRVEDPQLVEDFWEKTKTNLQAEKIRLVFVADQIQPELRRIVEFLNGQMDPAEVFAVEIPQYVGENQKAVVPRVLGLTTKAEIVKGKRAGRDKRVWDEGSFFQSVQEVNPDAVKPTRQIYVWAANRNLTIQWGQGSVLGQCHILVRRKESHVSIMYMETGPNVQSGVRVYIRVGKMKEALSPEEKTKLVEFLGRLNAIPDVKIPDGFLDDDKDRFPSFPITTLMNEESMSRFLDALEFIAGQIEPEGN